MDWKQKLCGKFGERCRLAAPLAPLTTYKIGGAAQALCLPANFEEAAFLLVFAAEAQIPFTVLGAGSNVLVSDAGVKGIVCSLARLSRITLNHNCVRAQAGALLDAAAEAAIAAGLGGLEKLSGIPGSVGGAVRMNAGAFGQETFDRLQGFTVMDGGGKVFTLKKTEIKHGYRSVAGLDGLIILEAEWELEAGSAAALKRERSEILAKRAQSQPLDYPSAGSVFKRPQGYYASRLIDAAGLKGRRVGGAEVSAKHAGFIINKGGATAVDVRRLMGIVKDEVKAKTGVELELEQVLLGEF